jgi:hypothetical protein
MQAGMRRHAAEVARAVRAGDASAELDARRELAFTRAELALRRILDDAPRLHPAQGDRLLRVIADRVEPSGPHRF